MTYQVIAYCKPFNEHFSNIDSPVDKITTVIARRIRCTCSRCVIDEPAVCISIQVFVRCSQVPRRWCISAYDPLVITLDYG